MELSQPFFAKVSKKVLYYVYEFFFSLRRGGESWLTTVHTYLAKPEREIQRAMVYNDSRPSRYSDHAVLMGGRKKERKDSIHTLIFFVNTYTFSCFRLVHIHPLLFGSVSCLLSSLGCIIRTYVRNGYCACVCIHMLFTHSLFYLRNGERRAQKQTKKKKRKKSRPCE